MKTDLFEYWFIILSMVSENNGIEEFGSLIIAKIIKFCLWILELGRISTEQLSYRSVVTVSCEWQREWIRLLTKTETPNPWSFSSETMITG